MYRQPDQYIDLKRFNQKEIKSFITCIFVVNLFVVIAPSLNNLDI